MMKNFAWLTLVLIICGCSESGYRKGHAGAQGSQAPIIDEPAGAERPDSDSKITAIYGEEYQPPRNFESSVLNEPDENSTNNAKGRGYRVNGSGYGFERD